MHTLICITTLLSLEFLAARAEAGAFRWSWQEPQATERPNGDLEWAPHTFEFKPG